MNKIPSDFSFKYRWCEGTVPPPHYYEYSIKFGAGLIGTINFYPDYPQHDLPAWIEQFAVTADAHAALYLLMTERDLFRQNWTEIQDAPVGGSLEWLDITADGVEYKIPSMIEESPEIESIYEAIRSLVPVEIWKHLISQREEFIRNYPIE